MREQVHERYRQQRDHWWFRARREIFDRVLAECADLPGSARVLDVGPGSGINLPVLSPRGPVTVLDRDLDSARACRAEGADSVVVADAENLPFAEASFDLTCALDVVEHLDDDRSAMRELFRVTRPGGHLLLSVPAFSVLWGRQDVLSEHRRRYRRREIRGLLEDAGFAIERLSYFNSLLFAPILAVRLLSRPFLGKAVKSGKSDLDAKTPFGLDRVLYKMFASEAGWLTRRNLPVGVSVLALARR